MTITNNKLQQETINHGHNKLITRKALKADSWDTMDVNLTFSVVMSLKCDQFVRKYKFRFISSPDIKRLRKSETTKHRGILMKVYPLFDTDGGEKKKSNHN